MNETPPLAATAPLPHLDSGRSQPDGELAVSRVATPAMPALAPANTSLAPGMRVELQIQAHVADNEVQVLLRPADTNHAWSQPLNARLTEALPARVPAAPVAPASSEAMPARPNIVQTLLAGLRPSATASQATDSRAPAVATPGASLATVTRGLAEAGQALVRLLTPANGTPAASAPTVHSTHPQPAPAAHPTTFSAAAREEQSAPLHAAAPTLSRGSSQAPPNAAGTPADVSSFRSVSNATADTQPAPSAISARTVPADVARTLTVNVSGAALGTSARVSNAHAPLAVDDIQQPPADVSERPVPATPPARSMPPALQAALLSSVKTAIATAPPETGRLLAEVVAVTPQLVLKPLPETTAAVARQWLQNQLRLHWPEARPLTETLTAWRAPPPSLSQLERNAAPLPQALHEILDRLPRAEHLTQPARLPAAFASAGIWLEALLARAAVSDSALPELPNDLKAQLLRLAERIRTALSALPRTAERAAAPEPRTAALNQLARETDGMLKHIVTQQLQTLDADPAQPRWMFELPFHSSAGLLALHADIERQRPETDEEETRWNIELRLDLPRLGPLVIALGLRGRHLDASLLAEQATGAALLGEQLARLRERLEARDFAVASLHAGQGQRPRPYMARDTLLSTHA